MNGVHDIGGMHGFGSVPVQADETFHEEWERLVFAMNLLLRSQGVYELDEFRHATERMDPADYYGAKYYERWLGSLERLLVEKGVVEDAELEAAYEQFDGTVPADQDPELRRQARELFENDIISAREATEPRFEEGDVVVVRNDHPRGHHRAPRYARRAKGVIRKVYGAFPLADAVAHGRDEAGPCYSVRFDASELWNEDTDADTVCLDMWEQYLEWP